MNLTGLIRGSTRCGASQDGRTKDCNRNELQCNKKRKVIRVSYIKINDKNSYRKKYNRKFYFKLKNIYLVLRCYAVLNNLAV